MAIDDELIAPVEVVAKRRDRSIPIQDDDFREPTKGSLSSVTLEFLAQVKYASGDDMIVEYGGERHVAKGYLVKRISDGITVKTNDQIVSIGQRTMDPPVWIVKITPFGHWDEAGGYLFERLHFNDKAPVKV